MALPFVEIAIERADLALYESFEGQPGEAVVLVADVLRQLEEARAGGTKVVLLSVDSGGGEIGAAFALYHALRSFSEAGGQVVAYVADLAASSAAIYVLGADFVVMHPRGAIWPHGTRTDAGGVFGEGCTDVDGAARLVGALLATHTLAPEQTIAGWLAEGSTADRPGGEELPAGRALEIGYADGIGERQHARNLADRLARGEPVTSLRRKALAERGEVQALAGAVREVREAGRLIGLLRSGT